MNFKIHDLIFSGQRISSGLACDENFRVVDGKHTEEFVEFYVFCLL